MLTQILESRPELQVFGLVALILFFCLFLLIIIRAWRADERYIKRMSSLPLDQTTTHGDEDHE